MDFFTGPGWRGSLRWLPVGVAVNVELPPAGVLDSSFIAEVKSDLMGEQTILCGMLQAGSLLCYDKMIADGIDGIFTDKYCAGAPGR